eukprot:GHRQ01024338.1.p2 GENE.GHRQ01024338.1~~GHRQ01024338.1.p2  ORF type:complete len:212 (-),score=65.55 GHRQ01024338.1:70-705(-)
MADLNGGLSLTSLASCLCAAMHPYPHMYCSTLASCFLFPANNVQAAADVLAMASLEVDLSGIEEGNTVTVKWRGKPVFIRHRTPEEISEAESEDVAGFRDPQTDAERVIDPKVSCQMQQRVAACRHASGRTNSTAAVAAAASGSSSATAAIVCFTCIVTKLVPTGTGISPAHGVAASVYCHRVQQFTALQPIARHAVLFCDLVVERFGELV